MKNYKIYRDIQNNKNFKGYRIRCVNKNVSSMRDAITIHLNDEVDADRVELFLYKLLNQIKND